LRTCYQVSIRRRPMVLRIRAWEMHKHGYQFFLSGNGIWQTESVPPEYINFPDADVGEKVR
jgi:putative RNA 2'-phosphotransferase